MDEAEHCDRLSLIYRGKLIAIGTPDELNAAYQGELLEVECEPLMGGLETLSKSALAYDVALFGASLHVTVSNAQSATPEIESALNQANTKVLRIEKIQPSLEDVFVSLIESQERVQGVY